MCSQSVLANTRDIVGLLLLLQTALHHIPSQETLDNRSLQLYVYRNNLTHYFSTCYNYFRIKAYREINLVRALDEDTRVFSFYLSSSPLAQTAVSGNSTLQYISDPGILCLLLDFKSYIYMYRINRKKRRRRELLYPHPKLSLGLLPYTLIKVDVQQYVRSSACQIIHIQTLVNGAENLT